MEAEFSRLQGTLAKPEHATSEDMNGTAQSLGNTGRGEVPPLAAVAGMALTDLKQDNTDLRGTFAASLEESTEEIDKTRVTASHKALEDMACYIDFMRTQIMCIYTMFDSVDLSKPTKVRFPDLWSLFRVGELVILRPEDKSQSSARDQFHARDTQSVQAEPLVGRVFWKEQCESNWDVDDLSVPGSGAKLHLDEDPDDEDEGEHMRIGLFHLDSNGEKYKAVPTYVNIHHFSGEKDVTSLQVSPLRFAKDHEQLVQNLEVRGAKFQTLISQSPNASLSYKGWALTDKYVHPLDDVRRRGPPGPRDTPIYVDSDIVVDFREAYKSHPWWNPSLDTYSKDDFVAQKAEDRFAVVRWANPDRTEVVERGGEILISDDAISNREGDHFLDSLVGRFLMEEKDWTVSQIDAGNVLSKEDLVLLPSRVFAYSLRDRKFINASLQFIKQSFKQDASSTFDKLQISDKHKGLIESVVYEHFQKKEAQKLGDAQQLEISDQDFIRGKGRGLVILLHGAPGVGKTATAEAISYAYNKPLFPITCGNLGTDPAVVEERLTELFRLASLWDCILLLDEAEIFLSPRAKTDDNLQRNAIVSGTPEFKRTSHHVTEITMLTTSDSIPEDP